MALSKLRKSISALLLLAFVLFATYLLQRSETFIKSQAASGPVQVQNLTDNKNSYSGSQIPKYSKFELSFTLSATYQNPFAPYSTSGTDATGAKADANGASVEGVFSTPSGEKRVVGFCYDNCDPSQVAQWKIRFTPTQTGNYTYYVKITDKNGTSTSDSGNFSVVESSNPGFLKTNGRFFQFENGTTFVPRGHHHQKTTSTSVIDDYYNYAKNTGMVSQHIWIHPDASCLEWIDNGKCGLPSSQALGRYDTDTIRGVDRFFDNTDMYYLFGQDDMILYGSDAASHLTWTYSPYKSVTSQSDVFKSSEAKAYYKRRLRYIVARWGYSPNVMGWELLSEIDWPFMSGIWEEDDLINWHEEMANYLHTNDPYDHLVTTNTAVSLNGVTNSNDYRYRLYRLSGINFITHNVFYGPNEMQYANMTMDRMFQYAGTNKPFMIGSWGLNNNSFQDTSDSLAMHNVIWLSVMRAGTTQHHWYWANYRSNNGTRHYLYLQNYLQSENFISDNLTPDKSYTTSNSQVEIYALAGSNKILGWAHDVGSNYSSQTNTNRSGVTVSLTGLTNGNYTVEYWNTWQGTKITSTSASASNGNLSITLPSFSRDIAFKVYAPGGTQTTTPTPTATPTSPPTVTPIPTESGSVNLKIKFQGISGILKSLLA